MYYLYTYLMRFIVNSVLIFNSNFNFYRMLDFIYIFKMLCDLIYS